MAKAYSNDLRKSYLMCNSFQLASLTINYMKTKELCRMPDINACAMTGRFEAFQHMRACCFPANFLGHARKAMHVKHAQVILTDWDIKVIKITTGLSSATQHPKRVAH